MKINKKFFSVITLVFGFAIFGAATFCIPHALADLTDNVTGYGWSANIGYVKTNNCTDITDTTSCLTGSTYGLNILPSDPGTISGRAWASNIGWISFPAVSSIDDGSSYPQCPGGVPCDAYADWAHPNSDGSIPIVGWARACSVFADPVACSGNLANSIYTGGWDGFISLSGKANDGSNYGLALDNKGLISGYAWGSEVIGWVNLSLQATVKPKDYVCTNLPNGPFTTVPPGYHSDGGTTTTCTQDFCSNIAGSTSLPPGDTLNADGTCTQDFCSNIAGSTSLPAGDIKNADGSCTPTQCADGNDNDGDGKVDASDSWFYTKALTPPKDKNGALIVPDPGCKNIDDNDERDIKPIYKEL